MKFILIGLIVTLYGWWCTFRTDQAQYFPQGRMYDSMPRMKSINFGVTVFHGIFALIAGPVFIIYGIRVALGFIK